MAQLLNRLRAEERIAGVEFWHSPERCGWLMKQGTGRRDKSAAESERRFALNEVLDFGASDATSRGNGDGGFGLPRPWRSSSRPRMRGPRARRSLRARGLRVLTTSLSLSAFFLSGEYIKTWRRRWFILKQGKIFWFKTEEVGPVSWDQRPPSLVARLVPLCSRFPRSQTSIPRGVVDISRCLSIKGAEDVINKAHAFELSTNTETMFFIADSDKEKEEWISSVGRAIVRQSKR